MVARSFAEIVGLLTPEFPAVVGRAAARAKAEIPVYESIPELEIREGIARDLGAALAALVQERGLSDEERAAMGLIGDTRARQEVPLEAMLRVYRIALDEVFRVLWDAGESGLIAHEEMSAVTREAWASANEIMDIAVASYRHRELELAVAETERRAALLHALLFTTTGATDAMIADAGVDRSGRYLAFRARTAARAPRDLLLDLQMPGVLDGGVVALHGDDVIGMAPDRPRLVPPADEVIALGPVGTLDALPRSFAVASRVLDAAAGRGGVLSITDVAVDAIARGEATLGDALVARFVTGQEAEVLETVRAYMEHGLSVEPAAQALGVHANTVRNRLQRFESATGASLRDVDDLVLARIALRRALS